MGRSDSDDISHARATNTVRPRSERLRGWRSRVLLRKGARMHRGLVNAGDNCALAMLDAMGLVLCWYEPAHGPSGAAGYVINRHVSQFYVPEDIAVCLPHRDLRRAVVDGRSTENGWRRRPGGAVFWATTVIDTVLLRDGRLQGFSYQMRACQGPWEVSRVASTRRQVDDAIDVRPLIGMGPFGLARESCVA